MCGGGGSAPTSTQQTVTQVTIPPELMPYAKKALGTAEDLAYNQPYQTYEGQRLAGLNPLQQQAMRGTAGLGPTSQIEQASGLASLVGQQAGQMGRSYQPMQYQPVNVSYMGTQAPSLQQYQMGPAERVGAERVDYGDLQAAQTGFRPDLQQYQMGPAERVQADTDFGEVSAPSLQQYQMGPAERVGAERFGGQAMQDYMSPYMSGVIEQQKRGAIQDYRRQMPNIGAAAARMGGRGGTREALLQSEANRNLQGQLQSIEATGLQNAFQQAQQQFGADRAAQMQAALANQQAGLTTGQQNLAALLGIQQFGAGQSLQAQQLNQAMRQAGGQMGLQAALANQQAGLTTGQQNLAALLGIQQLGTQTGLQTALANLSNEQQARVQREASRLQAAGMNQQSAMQAALANQQAGLTTGQQNLAAQLGIQQLGAQTGLQSQQLNQAAQLQAQQQALGQNQAAQQMMEQSRQFGAGLGLQGLQQQLAAAGTLGQLGQTQFNQQQMAAQAQQQAGGQMQQLEQARLQMAYEDFLNRQRYPYQQLGFMSDLIRGTPTGGGIQNIYGAQASPLGALAGLGGLYMAGRTGG